jgi:crossover junction endodeoxyribonuclease RuvC
MRCAKMKILAIDPGTREMGIALLEGPSLVYHGVKIIKNRRSAHEILGEGRRIILRLLNDFRPAVLVVEKTFFASKRSALLNVFADEIRALGKRKGLKVVSFAPNTVKKFISGNGRASKEEVAQVIVARFPELKVYLSQDRKWKLRYHENMFDAVALALTASNRLSPSSRLRKAAA